MAKFHHRFKLTDSSDFYRIYKEAQHCVRLDFVSESCLRVAVYDEGSALLPTFCIQPESRPLSESRARLDTGGFQGATPKITCSENTEHFLLKSGIDIELDTRNFLLSYRKNGKILFADRAPLAYNFENEFGSEKYHYITREKNEKIFGLGDKGGALNKAGRAFRIETTDCMGYDAASTDPLYKHIPFFMCENEVGCYGIFYDTSATSYADFGKEINNYYPAYKYFKTEDNCLVYYVFFGTKLSVLQQFGALCGRQAFPPRWSFDYCASTMAYTDAPNAEEQMNAFLHKLEEYALPCSGFYLSSGYTSIGKQRYVFHWNREKFPKPEAFIQKFSEKGIRILPNIKPAFLDTHPLYQELAEKGLFIKNRDGSPFVTEFWDGLGSYLDFTNPDAFDFWQEKVNETLLSLGIGATWNDNNEFDIKDNEALACGFGSGAVPANKIRPNLTYLMNAASYSAQIGKEPALRPFLSSRSGNIAVRRLAQTWSGDNRTCFEDLRYCHNIGLTMSLSGLYFYGHDLGGFHGEMPTRELLLRWLQHGVFEPRFTIHSWNEDGSATMPWSYPDIMPAVKALFEQRQRLIPYLYNCAYQAVEKEIPMNAPPLLYYDDEVLYAQNDSMLVGRDLLVGFIFDEGKNETELYLPKADEWYCGKQKFAGGTRVPLTVTPTQETPCFIRAGSVIATQERGNILLTVYPVTQGVFEADFFTDDGESFAYLDNRCVKLHFRVECTNEQVKVHYTNEGNIPFSPQLRLCEADRRKLIFKKLS